MKAEDIALIVRTIAPAMREFVTQSQQGLLTELAELKQRLLAVEQRALVPGKDGKDGKDVDPAQVERLVADQIQKAIQPIHEDLSMRMTGNFLKAVSELPVPKDGKDGTSVAIEDVEALVTLHVERAVKALPVPQDGRSVTIEDVTPLITSEVSKAVERLPVPQNGKDGIGLTGALIDRDGQLVVTLSDGTAKAIGGVVGKDTDPADVQRMVADEVAKIPRPKDGEKGADGRDGSLEQLKVVKTGDRSWAFVFKNGDPIEGGALEFEGLPIPRGRYKLEAGYESGIYKKGDIVTWSGGWWIAKSDVEDKQPGTNEGAPFWQLTVKPGQQGKTGPKGDKGDTGLRGEKGMDGRNGYSG